MANINVIDIFPISGSTYTPIDSKIIITFDAPIDPFTLPNGISLFTRTDGLWSGPDLSILDNKFSDVLTMGDEFAYFQYDTQILDNTVTLIPKTLFPDKTYFVQILPGDDVTRYLSIKTFGDPVYLRSTISPSQGILNILSSYNGSDDIYSFTFSRSVDGLNIDILKGSEYIGMCPYEDGAILPIEDIKLSLTGPFSDGDIVTLDVFKAKGVSQVYKASFTTTEYKISAPTTSRKVSSLSEMAAPLRILDARPSDGSINNSFSNPITIRFDKPVLQDQEFADKIKIKKVDMTTGEEKLCKYYTKINGNILKIYLTGFF